VPRLINVICDRALLGAYVENQYAVNPSILKKAATEVFGELKNVEQKQKNKQRLYPIAVFFSFLILAFVVVSYFKNNTEIASDSPQDIIVTDIKNESSSTYSEAIIQTSLDDLPTEIISIGQISEVQPTENLSTTAIDTEYDNINEILNDDSYNPTSAYQELFKTWGLHYNDKTSITACNQAKTYSLSCLYKHGNINNLKTHNRPAVLTLTNNQGLTRHITITSIDKNLATVFSNNKTYTVKLDDIDKHWYGSFILLWHKPEHYSSAITPGDSGDIITWLNTQLVKINKTQLTDIISVYDDYLIEKVKAFQLQQGLTADGIVGPVTIIHINTQSGIKAPSLKPSAVNPIMKQN
jgi:general secretion pathway protein A